MNEGIPSLSGHAERFGGLGRLYGREALARMRDAHVCVMGVGGVGSWTVEGLARSGVGALTLVDLDDVCVTNVNRQLPALDGQIGRPKITVLAERIRLINPACRVTEVARFFTAKTAEAMLGGVRFDCVVDAIDNTNNKALLIAESLKRGMPCVTVGGAGGKRDATLIRTGDLGESGGDDLLRRVRQTLRADHGFAKGSGNRYGVRAVFSAEKPVYPWADGTCATEPEPGTNLKLDCASGFGTAVWLTAAFGLVAAQEAAGCVMAGRS